MDQNNADTFVDALQFEAGKSVSGWVNHKCAHYKTMMTQTIKRKNRVQRPNDQHHRTRKERMEDLSGINVQNLDIYKEIVSPEL